VPKRVSEIAFEEITPKACIVAPKGYLERKLGEELKEFVRKVLDQGYKDIVVSFAEVPLVNSLGVSGIIEVFDLIDSNGAEIWFADATKEVESVLEVAGVLNMVPKIYTSEEARQAIISG